MQEWQTPDEIFNAARATLGGIDLDPASCAQANLRIKAMWYHDKETDGLKWPWDTVPNRQGFVGQKMVEKPTVFLNPPFGRWENSRWVAKAIREYLKGNVDAMCILTFASTSERWFQDLFRHSTAQCWLSPRTAYINPDNPGKRSGAPKGSVVSYFGTHYTRFESYFGGMGNITCTLYSPLGVDDALQEEKTENIKS